jgi:predicted DNA-binding transcriptional regulator AlpA
MSYGDKRPFTKNGGARTSSRVRLGIPPFAVDEQRFQKAARARGGLDGSSGVESDSQGARPQSSAINPILEKRASQRPRTFDEALDAMQLLTVTDVCKLLRISKPTLWRLRRSGSFPDPTTVTERIFGWRRLEIDNWLASRNRTRHY